MAEWRVVKPNRQVNFVYDELSKYITCGEDSIMSVLITEHHIYCYVNFELVDGDVPSCCVSGSGMYSVLSKGGPVFSLYVRYCEPLSSCCLRFYIDHKRNKHQRDTLSPGGYNVL